MGSKFVERVVYHAYVMIQLPVCIEPVYLVFAAFHNLPLGRLLSQSHLFFLNIIPSNSLLLKYLAGSWQLFTLSRCFIHHFIIYSVSSVELNEAAKSKCEEEKKSSLNSLLYHCFCFVCRASWRNVPSLF